MNATWDGKEALRAGHLVRLRGETHLHVVLEATDERGDMPRVLVEALDTGMAIAPTERADRADLLPGVEA